MAVIERIPLCGAKSEWYFNDNGYEVRSSCTFEPHATGGHSWQATVDAADKEDDYGTDLDDEGNPVRGTDEVEPDVDQETAAAILTEAQRATESLRVRKAMSADVTMTTDEQIRAMKALLQDAYSIRLPLHAARKLGPNRMRFLVGMCAAAWSGQSGPQLISGDQS